MASILGEVGPLLFVLVGGVVVVVAAVLERHRRKHKERDLARLLARDPSLVRTVEPCGLSTSRLAQGFEATRRGDRRYGLEYAVSGMLPATVLGAASQVECAAFRWWWEERRRRRTQHGTRTTYVRQDTVVAAVRLFAPIVGAIVLRPESALGRVGLTRGGHQLESSEFNRRFRVEAPDRTQAVTLLDAGMQQLLTEAFPGRTVELRGDVLLLAGAPTHRDPTLAGVVGELPAVRQDAQRLVSAIPATFWRAVGVTAPG